MQAIPLDESAMTGQGPFHELSPAGAVRWYLNRLL